MDNIIAEDKTQEGISNVWFCFFGPKYSFFVPFLWGTPLHYIVLLFSSQPYTCWSSKHLLKHLSHQTPLSLSLWVAEAKVVLFRGLFLINTAKRIVGAQLMWWWQLSIRYFGFYSFYMLGGWTEMVGASSSSGLRNVQGGVTPRTGFFAAIGTE